jgi:uncharacterized protein (DUF362 family)
MASLRVRLGMLLRGQRMRLLGAPARVGLVQCQDYGSPLSDALRELWHLAGMPDVSGLRVLVKPNLIDFIEGYTITTAPAVVTGVAALMRELGAASVVVGDGPGFRREAAPVARGCGLAALLAEQGVPFVDLNYDEPAPVSAPAGWFGPTRELWLPRHVREADLIVSLPKMKTHHWAGVSLSLKNLYGIFPGCRYGWPKNQLHINGITSSILGLYQAARALAPVVSIVDGVTGMEGDGPLFGRDIPHGLLAAGRDPVAVDSICAGLMGFGLDEVDHLALAASAGVGQATRVEVAGASPDSLRLFYQRPPNAD